MNPRQIVASLGYILISALPASPASAQSALYVAGAAFADIKQFDSLQYDPRALISSGSTSTNGTSPGGAIRVGTFLHPSWSLEIGVEAEGRTTAELENPYADILRLYPMLRAPQLSESSSFLTVNTAIGFHPAKFGRVRMGYLGGVSFVRGTYRSTLPDFGSFTTLEAYVVSGAVTSVSSRTPTLPNFRTTIARRTDNAIGALIGLEAAVDMTSHIAAVPGIRVIAFSSQGQTILLIRPEVGARWSF